MPGSKRITNSLITNPVCLDYWALIGVRAVWAVIRTRAMRFRRIIGSTDYMHRRMGMTEIANHRPRILPLLFRKVMQEETEADRKSTRLNSSHSQISYAVFCLKKKTQAGAASTITSSPIILRITARLDLVGGR